VELTPQKLLVIGLVPGWFSVAGAGFVAYHDTSYMKFFLAMNFLMLAYTLIVQSLWIRRNLATPRKLLVIGLVPGWLGVAAMGFVAYLETSNIKFFLAMIFLMLVYTSIVSSSWTKRYLKK